MDPKNQVIKTYINSFPLYNRYIIKNNCDLGSNLPIRFREEE